MWQKWGGRQQQPPPPVISHPMYFMELDQEEERYLETIPEVDSISSRRQSLDHSLPALPFRVVSPLYEIPQPVNTQHGQTKANTKAPASNKGLKLDTRDCHSAERRAPSSDVSPITPQPHSHRSYENQPVSPIDPAPASQLSERDYLSKIPRKVAGQNGFRDQAQTKWDLYSGEPTTDNRGVVSSVRPGTQSIEMHFPQLKERTKQILAELRETHQASQAAWSRQIPPVREDPLENLEHQGLVRGMKKEATPVDPIRNDISAPKYHPQKHIDGGNATSTSDVAPVHHRVTSSPATQTIRTVISEESIKAVEPLRVQKREALSPSKTKQNLQSPFQTPYPHALSYQPTPEYAYARNDSPSHDEPEPITPVTPTPLEDERLMIAHELEETPGKAQDFSRDQSRFSWTTYATTEPDSPSYLVQRRGSPPPMPTLPPNITIQKRPVSEAPTLNSYTYQSSTTGSIVRKPMPRVSIGSSAAQTASQRALSMSKTLPPTPTVLEATDKIENLEAQVQALERRRYNTTRIIHDLEVSLVKNAITYDMWKRREIEKRIASHNSELDDISRDIHELNIQINRVQRKRDKADGYENCTGLWIKRVTT